MTSLKTSRCHILSCTKMLTIFSGLYWVFAFAMHEFSISERKICLLPVKIRSVLQEHSTIAQYVIERSSTKQVWCSIHNKNGIHASTAKDHLPNSNLTGTLIPPKIIRKIFTMLLVQAIFNSWLNLCELSFQTNQGNLIFPVQNYNTDTRRSTARLSADTTIVLSLCSAIQMKKPNIIDPEDGRTPVHLACWKGHADCLKLLLSKGGNLYLRDHNRDTPISLARDYACLSIILLHLAGKWIWKTVLCYWKLWLYWFNMC